MTTTSNFGKYFRYKLSRNKAMIFVFALVNLVTVIFPFYLEYDSGNFYVDYYKGDYAVFQAFEGRAFYFMLFSMIVSTVMITVTTVKSMNIYHERAAVDTMASLPLTYRERFWGDISSSICTNFISFVPSVFISLIFDGIIKKTVKENAEIYAPGHSSIIMTHTTTSLLILMMISYLGVYAVTTFVNSCCGRFSTAVVFSLVASTVIPGVFTVYGNYFYSNFTGADPYWEVGSKVGLLPPFGALYSVMMRWNDLLIPWQDQRNFDYLLNRPVCFIVPALVIAAFLIGAYYIGKLRKIEKTGDGFLFKSVFYVLLITLLVTVIGLAAPNYSGERGAFGAFLILACSFVLYFALEYSQHKSFKNSWKTVIRFAAVTGACVGSLTLIRTTGAFGAYKRLPGENSIKEIRVSGEYFFSQYGSFADTEHIYRSGDSISAILNGHKKLLEEDGLETGYRLNIIYVTKLGQEIRREYAMPNGDGPLKDFSYAVRELEEFDPNVLGVIGGTDFDNISIRYVRHNRSNNSDLLYLENCTFRSDKIEEFAKILRGDIEKYYFDDNETGRSTVGDLIFYDLDSVNEYNRYGVSISHYRILDVYEDTAAFLNDPANYIVVGDDETVNSYHISYNTDSPEGLLSELSVTVSEDDESEYAKELLSYIEDGYFSGHSSSRFKISDSNINHGYGISTENEQAALKAMIGLFREKYAQ